VAAGLFIAEEHRMQIKKDVKQKLIAVSHQQLVKLAFTQKEELTRLKWHDEKEFEWNGEMYDVVETQINGDTTFYLCWWDHEETELNKKLDELVADALGNSTKNRQNKNKLLELFEMLYVADSTPEKPSVACSSKQTNYTGQHIYQSISLSHPFPPPELA